MKGWKVCIGALLLCAVLSSAITVDRRKLNLDEIAREYTHVPATATELVEVEDHITMPDDGKPEATKCVKNVPNVRGVIPSSCCGDNKCTLPGGVCCAGDSHCCPAGHICMQGDPGTPPGCLNIVERIPKEWYDAKRDRMTKEQKESNIENPDKPQFVPVPEDPSRKENGKLNYEDAFASHHKNPHVQVRTAVSTNHHIKQYFDSQKKSTLPKVESAQQAYGLPNMPSFPGMAPSSIAEQKDVKSRRAEMAAESSSEESSEDVHTLVARAEAHIRRYGGKVEEKKFNSQPQNGVEGDKEAPWMVMVPGQKTQDNYGIKTNEQGDDSIDVHFLPTVRQRADEPDTVQESHFNLKAKAVLDYRFRSTDAAPVQEAQKQGPVTFKPRVEDPSGLDLSLPQMPAVPGSN